MGNALGTGTLPGKRNPQQRYSANKQSGFFHFLDFLPGNARVAPRSNRFWGAGFDAADSIRRVVTAALKPGQDVMRARRTVVKNVLAGTVRIRARLQAWRKTDISFAPSGWTGANPPPQPHI